MQNIKGKFRIHKEKGGCAVNQELKRYDVVLVNFGENVIDSEQAGIRPAVVIQNDTGNFFSSTTIVMPLTSKIKNISQPTHTLIKKGKEKGLVNDSILLGECMRQISKKRIVKSLGSITSIDEKMRFEEFIMLILENR